MSNLSLVILGRFLTWEFEDVREGITHRHYGLYRKLSQMFLESGEWVYWYSFENRKLREISGDAYEGICEKEGVGALSAVLTSVRRSFDKDSIPAIMVNYPHTFRGMKHLFTYTLLLVVLWLLKKTGKAIVILDNIDPPIPHQEYLGENEPKRLMKTAIWYLLEPLAHASADKVILLTESWKKYYERSFNLSPDRVEVIPCGSFPEAFHFEDSSEADFGSNKLMVIYAGHASKDNNVDKLARVVDELGNEGIDISLTVTGQDLLGLKSDFVKVLDGVNAKRLSDELVRSDIAMVTYTGNYRSFTSLAKVGDYLMGGSLLMSFPLLETSKLIKRGKCGILVRDFDQMKKKLRELSKSKSVVFELCRRARAFAEKEMDYAGHAEDLYRIIDSTTSKKMPNVQN